MRKTTLIFVIAAMLSFSLFAADNGHISINAKVSIYDPPGDASVAPMFTLQARYRLSAFLALVGSGSWTNYEYDGADITYIPVALDGELHFLGRSTFDPYAGIGISFNYKNYNYDPPTGDETDLTLGADILGGITYKPTGNFGFDLEAKYRIEDIANIEDSGSWSLGGGITGSWEKDL